MSFVAFLENFGCTLVPTLFLLNCEKAAVLIEVFVGSAIAGASEVPLMPSLPGSALGSGRPASSASVGYTSTCARVWIRKE